MPMPETSSPSTAFDFGENWSNFLGDIDAERVEAAQKSLINLLGSKDLTGNSFLDAGSGSGLFSLAARQLGAKVTSFDYNPKSVQCTATLRDKFKLDNADWRVEHGSILDLPFMQSIGQFDVVYCWGVAHHTGQMWTAINHLATAVKPGGSIVLAIYNDESYISEAWVTIKRLYNRLPVWFRPVLVAAVGIVFFSKRLCTTIAASAFRILRMRNPLTPFVNWANDTRSRGMSSWHDLVDWVGGWPFEVASPEAVFRVMRDQHFVLTEMVTAKGHGCNEFVFRKKTLTH